MSDEELLPSVAPDEGLGDRADQASRLQEFEEQQAIDAALGKEPTDSGDVLDPEYIARLTQGD